MSCPAKLAVLHAQLRPLGDLAVLAVDLGQLLHRDRVQRVVFVDVDGQGVVADDDFLGLAAAVGSWPVRFRSASSCGWCRPGRNCRRSGWRCPRPSRRPSTCTLIVRVSPMVLFGPGLGHVDHRVGALDADHLPAVLFAAACIPSSHNPHETASSSPQASGQTMISERRACSIPFNGLVVQASRLRCSRVWDRRNTWVATAAPANGHAGRQYNCRPIPRLRAGGTPAPQSRTCTTTVVLLDTRQPHSGQAIP